MMLANRWSVGQHFKALNVHQIGDRYVDNDDNDQLNEPILIRPE